MPIAATRKPTRYGQLLPPFPAGGVVAAAQERYLRARWVSQWHTRRSSAASPVHVCGVQPALGCFHQEQYKCSSPRASYQGYVNTVGKTARWLPDTGAHHHGACAPCGFVASANFSVAKPANTSRWSPPSPPSHCTSGGWAAPAPGTAGQSRGSLAAVPSGVMEGRRERDLTDASVAAQLTIAVGDCDLLRRADSPRKPLLHPAAQVLGIQSCDLPAPQPRGRCTSHLHSWETHGLRWDRRSLPIPSPV